MVVTSNGDFATQGFGGSGTQEDPMSEKESASQLVAYALTSAIPMQTSSFEQFCSDENEK